jgi:hypothetical protein
MNIVKGSIVTSAKGISRKVLTIDGDKLIVMGGDDGIPKVIHRDRVVSVVPPKLKLGDRVKTSDPYFERALDTGIIDTIEGDVFVVRWDSDGKIRRYTWDELMTE